MGGAYLGLAHPAANQIRIDDDAARFGWSVASDRLPITGMDLLTVVMHELGHLLRCEHSDDAQDLMAPVLSARGSRAEAVVPLGQAWWRSSVHPSSFIHHSASARDEVFAKLGGESDSQDDRAPERAES